MAATAKAFDDLLTKYEANLDKLENLPPGSSVKLMKLENDILASIEKARDMMTASLQDKDDKDRAKMMEIFGGECVRISKMRAYLDATKLSDKTKSDKRFEMCISSCAIIERVLQEKGCGAKLDAANKRFFPFVPKKWGADGEPPPEPAPAPKVEPPKPAPAPEPAGYEAPKPAPAPAPSQASEKNVVSSTGTAVTEVDVDVPHKITVTVSSELAPTFDFGPGGTMVVELAGIKVMVNAVSAPAWPSSAKPFIADQEFWIPTAELTKVIFDPKNPEATPGGAISAVMAGQGEILEAPEWMTLQVARQTQAPWGSHKLIEGKNETEFYYDVEVESSIAMSETDDGGSALGIGLSVKFTGFLTGHKSAAFQPDGQPKDAPIR